MVGERGRAAETFVATVLHKPDEARIRAGILGAAALQINHSSGTNPEEKYVLTVI